MGRSCTGDGSRCTTRVTAAQALSRPAMVRRRDLRAPVDRRPVPDHQQPVADGGAIELDGQRVTVGAGHAVLIRPGVRHRAIGRMSILNVVAPPFDPAGEWFDGAGVGRDPSPVQGQPEEGPPVRRS